MLSNLASFFIILMIGSIPGQILLFITVISFRKTRLQNIDVRLKKFLLLSGFFTTLLPLFYLLSRLIIVTFEAESYPANQLVYGYYPVIASPVLFRNEWVIPLALVWSIGVLVSLYRSRKRLIDFRDNVMLEGSLCSASELQINYSMLPDAVLKHIRRLTIIRHPAAQSPLVFGYRRCFLVLPDQDMTEKQLGMVFRHEVAHLQHRDLWIKLLAELVRSVFFFNPVFVMGIQELNQVCEQLCDRTVTKEMSAEDKREYSHLLLNMLEQARPENSKTYAALSEDMNQLKRRLQMIINPFKMTRMRQGLISLLTVTLVFLSATAIMLIIPEVNKWDQTRIAASGSGRLPLFNSEAETQMTTSAYVSPEDLRYPEHESDVTTVIMYEENDSAHHTTPTTFDPSPDVRIHR